MAPGCPEQRGRVDNNASADSDLFDLRAEWQIDPNASLNFRARHFDDERGNECLFDLGQRRLPHALFVLPCESLSQTPNGGVARDSIEKRSFNSLPE